MERPRKQAIVLQHHDCETLGIIADALRNASIASSHIHALKGQRVPKEIGDAAGLIIMGGPQSVYEQNKFPWLRAEIRLIEDALKCGKPVLGICLGSQLLATALGTKVYAGRKKEIGWHRVTLSDFAKQDAVLHGAPGSFVAFHWHGDIFDLPRGATLLASSALTARQAFRYNKNAYGLLFHLEVTQPQITQMVETFSDELQSAGLNGSAIKLNAHTHLPKLQKNGTEVFARWVGLL
jgi:GMP synthase (glutamine-hydrolysing)